MTIQAKIALLDEIEATRKARGNPDIYRAVEHQMISEELNRIAAATLVDEVAAARWTPSPGSVHWLTGGDPQT